MYPSFSKLTYISNKKHQEVLHRTHKIETWGGHGGSPKDIIEPPKRLESITVKSGVVIDSITFTYIDETGKKHTAGPWGGSGGSPYKVSMIVIMIFAIYDDTYNCRI